MSNEKRRAPGATAKALFFFVVFLVLAIWFLTKLATSGYHVDAEVMTKEAIASRLKQAGESKATDSTPGLRTGEQVYTSVCSSCHGSGLAGAPKLGNKNDWTTRISKGWNTLAMHAIHGYDAMPAKGGAPDLSDDEVKRAVAYMGNSAGATFTEPPLDDSAITAPTPMLGKSIYDSVCIACHASGIAGAPRLGDKAAWSVRMKAGLDEVVRTGIKGLNAMPAKGGYAGSDADFRLAVKYMLNNSGHPN